MMLLSLVPVGQVLELRSVCPRLDSKLLAFLSYSQPGLTLSLLKVELTLLLETCIKITGSGTSTTPLKVLIGLVIKTLFNT